MVGEWWGNGGGMVGEWWRNGERILMESGMSQATDTKGGQLLGMVAQAWLRLRCGSGVAQVWLRCDSQ
jgi:hypothetical protein